MTRRVSEVLVPDGLEPSLEEMQRMLDLVLARLLPEVATLSEQPSHYDAETCDGVALARRTRESMPEVGSSLDALLGQLFEELLPATYNAAGPGYLGYIPGGGVFHAAIADLIANALNRYTGVWIAAPGLVQLETNVLRWFCDMVGYPQEASGWLTSGGSLATLTALTTARRERLPPNFLKGTLYTSDQSHHSVQKAAMLVGFPPKNVRMISSDRDFRIHLPTLRATIAADRDAGMTPFCIVGHAGTTNTGAVDPIEALASVARAEGMWLHIDAAYGGFFVLTEEGRRTLAGLAAADSITLDPHKGLFLPYGTGALLVRDLAALRRTHSVDGDYMPAMQESEGLLDICAISPELSRDFRGLRAWLPLKLCGVAAWREYLDEKRQLANWITEQLKALSLSRGRIEITAPPALSLLAFRYVEDGLSQGALNQFNQQWIASINARQRVFLTGTWTADRACSPVPDDPPWMGEPLPKDVFLLRICVLCFRTHMPRMQMALEDIHEALADLLMA